MMSAKLMGTTSPVAKTIANGWRQRAWGVFCLLLGFLLRVWQFGWYPLREDEALYGYWARLIASGKDVMLEWVAVDKPPFFLYSLARWFQWFGPSDAAGRSFNVLISFVTMIFVWRLAQRLYGARVGLWALAFFALSPFAISFAPTMYMDPMLTMWIVLALWAASYRLGLLAGLALGMGFATKRNALLWIPLVWLALLLGQWPRIFEKWLKRISSEIRIPHAAIPLHQRVLTWIIPLLSASLGFAYIWYKVWQWDGWRILPAHIPDFWTQAWHSYGGLGIVSPWAWPTRLLAWWEVWRWWGGSVAGTLIMIVLSLIATFTAWRQLQLSLRFNRWPETFKPSTERSATLNGVNSHAWTLLFAGYTLAYLLLHVVVRFQPWDRYLLPLAPLSAMLTAQGAVISIDKLHAWKAIWRRGLILGVGVVLSLGAMRAAAAKIPVGGDHGAYAGLLSVARYLDENVPSYHGVIYQRWLGWQWNWYLWDRDERVYWADEKMLVQDVARDPYGYARFVVFPGWQLHDLPALEDALTPLGLHLEERLRVTDPRTGDIRFVVYEIEPHIKLFER